MPVGVIPNKSGVHRAACCSLYKQLLKACAAFPSANAEHASLPSRLQSLVRYRFSHDRTIRSAHRVRDALALGESALDRLHAAASGSPEALKSLVHILSSSAKMVASASEVKAHVAKDKGKDPPSVMKKREYDRMMTDPANHRARPGAIPIEQRPVPLDQIKSGKRFVPRYMTTQGIAFLVYGKKQPVPLSMYIRRSINEDEKTWNHRQAMEAMVVVGDDEDEWDRILAKNLGVHNPDAWMGQYGSWAKSFSDAEKEVYSKIKDKDRKQLARGKMLWNIALRERELADQEKREARARKRKSKKLGKVSQETSSDKTGASLEDEAGK